MVLTGGRIRASDGPMFGGGGGCGMGFVELFGADRTFEFMPFARHAKQGNRHSQDGENFHRAAS